MLNDRFKFSFEWKDYPSLAEFPFHIKYHIKKLFRSWNDTLSQYEEAYGDELPYVYDERAQVGLLAVAARQINGFPIMEFFTSRIGNISKHGYGDLAVFWPRQKDETWMEVSHIRVPWNNWSHEHIYEKFWHARKGIRSLKDRRTGLALVFLRFYDFPTKYYLPSTYRVKIRELYNNLVNTTQRLKADFFTIHMCDPEIVLKTKSSNDCPGIAAIGKLYKSP